MLSAALVLDLVLGLVLVLGVVRGYRTGLLRSLGALIGIAAGAVAALLLAPRIGALVAVDELRIAATGVVALVLVVIGHGVGSAVGSLFQSPLRLTPLGTVNRLLGAAATVAVRALALAALASVVGALGVPVLNQPLAGSVVLRTIDAATPAPIDSALGQLRFEVVASGIPQLGLVLRGGTHGSVPRTDTATPALRTAARSVVKITGRAVACSQDQSGSGFVVAADRVLTNAHVVAGIVDPVVTAPNGQSITGRVIHFDRKADLALIAVPGLRAPALRMAKAPKVGDKAVVDGYPFGGPFTSGGARVLQIGATHVPDIGGSGTSTRALATIAADVEQGNSGGPLLTPKGAVLGIVFAKSSATSDLGYAMTHDEFGSVVRAAGPMHRTVTTGACIRG